MFVGIFNQLFLKTASHVAEFKFKRRLECKSFEGGTRPNLDSNPMRVNKDREDKGMNAVDRIAGTTAAAVTLAASATNV